jgi:hypothetical protein
VPSPTGAGELKGTKVAGAGSGVGASAACEIEVVVVVVGGPVARVPDRAEYVA